jgi:glycosyltransferase involved in cell wall biosynthesis
MKVCLASRAPFVGGAEIAAERLALGLNQAGCDVLVVLGARGAVMERMQRVGLRCVYSPMSFTDRWRWWRYLAHRQALRRLLRAERPDIVHSNDLPTHQMVSDAARGLGLPRICHHRYVYERVAIDWFNKFGAEQHLFVSRALMDELCDRSERLRASRRATIHDGVPLPSRPTDDQRRSARQRLGLPCGRLIVTFAGRVIETKGVEELLRTWATLAPAWGERAELVIVGEDLDGNGRYRREMQALSEALGGPARFVGFQEQVGDWLLASDLAVVPSRVEPLGNATLEAMAYALPLVACAVGGIPEMVTHGHNGLLVPPRAHEQLAAAITRCLEDAELRRRLGEEGRRRCEADFSLQAQTAALVREYQRLLR